VCFICCIELLVKSAERSLNLGIRASPGFIFIGFPSHMVYALHLARFVILVNQNRGACFPLFPSFPCLFISIFPISDLALCVSSTLHDISILCCQRYHIFEPELELCCIQSRSTVEVNGIGLFFARRWEI